jgi:prephenate dehydrogenase
VFAHRWAQKILPAGVCYVGSHPIAGAEKRGVEFARDDLLERSLCIVTQTDKTKKSAVTTVKNFWSSLGCSVTIMTPSRHDKIFADVSHVPHIVAAALTNATDENELEFAGRGFIDSSRIAMGPANIWTDVFLTNSANTKKGIEKVITELKKLRYAIEKQNGKRIEALLESAQSKRTAMIQRKMRRKEPI